VSTVQHPPHAVELLGERLEFDTLISDLSSRFINLPPGEVDREIQGALRRVCDLVGIDFAVLWQWSGAAPEAVLPTHAYFADEAWRPSEAMREDQYPWAVQQVLAGRMFAMASLDDYPPEGAVDRETLRRFGVKSGVCLPLTVGGEPPIGALGLNVMREERSWPDALVKRLQLVAQVFTHALARQRADRVLRESEEVSRATFEQAAVGIAHVGIDGRWLRVNDKLCAIVGYPREELLQLTFQDITHSDDLETDVRYVRQVLSGEITTCSLEKRYICKDHSVVWVDLAISLVRTAMGEPRYFIAVVEDITDRKRTEEALRVSEARLAAAAELGGVGYVEVDEGTGTVFADDRLRELIGFPPDRELGMPLVAFWMEHIHPDDVSRVLGERQDALDGKREELRVEYRYLHPARGEMWLQHIGRPTTRDATAFAVKSLGVIRDITKSKRAADDQLSLSRSLIEAHEEERALLARELHDDLTQRLAVMAIDLGRAELAGAGVLQAEMMRAVREGLVRMSEDIHSLAYQLHPSVLDELGLAEAIRSECERVGRQSQTVLSAEIDPACPAVGRHAALCLYRVAQEALSNVIHHAGARAASVILNAMDGGLLLAVRDDGVGFDPENSKQRRSLGLASMHERLRLVNGTLDIDSAPGRGTAIVAWVPGEGASP
jgi:PAS domain S-box-containing protein